MRNSIITLCSIIVFCSIGSCSKEKCKDTKERIEPFLQMYGKYECNTNAGPYTKIYWNVAQIDSAKPTCYYVGPSVYPVDYNDNLYMVVADSLFYYSDTITGEVFRDDCKKEITYNLKFVQGSKNPYTYPGLASIFCIIENVTPDYKVVINKERINLP